MIQLRRCGKEAYSINTIITASSRTGCAKVLGDFHRQQDFYPFWPKQIKQRFSLIIVVKMPVSLLLMDYFSMIRSLGGTLNLLI